MTQVDPAYKRLAQFRRKGESDEEFGERIGVSQQTVYSWKNGRYKVSRDALESAAEKFGVSVDWLIYGDREPTDHPNRPAIVDQLYKVIGWVQGEAVDWTPGEPPPIREDRKGIPVSGSDGGEVAGQVGGEDDADTG